MAPVRVLNRRGDPGQWAPLDEAWALAAPTQELPRVGPVAAASAEAAWLAGDRAAVDEATGSALRLALELRSGPAAGELAHWRRRAALDVEVPADATDPYRAPARRRVGAGGRALARAGLPL